MTELCATLSQLPLPQIEHEPRWDLRQHALTLHSTVIAAEL